jgi:type II secretory pathway component PulC
MKQNLWILNSSLLIIFITSLLLNNFLKQEIPVISTQLMTKKQLEEKVTKKERPKINIEKIYEQDIFGTYSPGAKPEPFQKNLVTPIPEYTPHKITPPPAPKKQEFIDPLKIKISGIVSSSNEEKNVAMIMDETNKENIYRFGEKIKDGQIIKISKNRIVILRANGQQDIFFLKEEEAPGQANEEWKYIVKKIDENTFVINPREFTKKIETLGQLLEDFSLIPAYQKGEAIGLRISDINNENIPSFFGVNKNDIITSINEINTKNTKDRIKIYDTLTQATLGDIVEVSLLQDGKEKKIIYKLEKIEKPKKNVFLQPATEGQTTQAARVSPELKPNEQQEKERKIREFEKAHKTPRQQDVIQDIRKRILANMKNRTQNRRVR